MNFGVPIWSSLLVASWTLCSVLNEVFILYEIMPNWDSCCITMYRVFSFWISTAVYSIPENPPFLLWMLDKFNIWYSELLYLSSPKLLDDSDQKEKKIMCFCLLICYYKWMCRMPDHVWLLVCGKPIWKNQNFSILICPWQLLTTPPVISDSEIFILQTYCSVFWSYHPLHPILYILIECYIHE